MGFVVTSEPKESTRVFCKSSKISNRKQIQIAGFFDFERLDFAYLIENLNLIDVFRQLNPIKRKSTYWSYFLKKDRNNENGWRIDYFLVSNSLAPKIKASFILNDVKGSDHCPVGIEF